MPEKQNPSAEDVRRLFGEINAHKIAKVLEIRAMLNDLDEAAAHLAGEADVMGELERPFTGNVLRIFGIVRRYDAQYEKER